MSGSRIGRVRMKDSGTEVRVLDRPRRDGLAAVLVEHAAIIADASRSVMTGFLIIGVDRDGAYNVGMRLEDDAPFGPTLFGAFCAEAARRSTATTEEVASFCVRQGWLSE